LFGIVGNIANLMTLTSPRLRQVSYMCIHYVVVDTSMGCSNTNSHTRPMYQTYATTTPRYLRALACADLACMVFALFFCLFTMGKVHFGLEWDTLTRGVD
jgi:hypothetical protein